MHYGISSGLSKKQQNQMFKCWNVYENLFSVNDPNTGFPSGLSIMALIFLADDLLVRYLLTKNSITNIHYSSYSSGFGLCNLEYY